MSVLRTDRKPKTQLPPSTLAHEGPRGHLLSSSSAWSDGGCFSREGKFFCLTSTDPEVWAYPLASVNEWFGLPDPPMPNLGSWGVRGREASEQLGPLFHTAAGIPTSSATAGQRPEERNRSGDGRPDSVYQQQWFAASPWSRAERARWKGTRAPVPVTELASRRNSINLC